MKAFEEWYEKTEFDSWGQHTVADLKAGYKAGMLRAAEALCKNCEAEGLNVRCDLCTDVAAIYKEVTNDQTR